MRMSPHFIPMLIANMASGHVAMRYKLLGPTSTVVTACSTSSGAIGDAFRIIERGEATYMIAGGSEAPITPMGIGGFAVMRALSTRNDSPETASRPFSASRDGFVAGEGAGILVLEDYDHACRRGARILAEIVGYATTSDAHHVTAPAPGGSGAVRCLQGALKSAGLRTDQIGYINAHGTSTYYNDMLETQAIKQAFGDHAKELVVSSTKSMTGHLLGAAGAIEAIACINALNEGIIPPTINYNTPDPECDLNYAPNNHVKKDINIAMSNSFGFGGHNSVLIFKKF